MNLEWFEVSLMMSVQDDLDLDEYGLPQRIRKKVESDEVVHRLKIISAGDADTGKSCLIKRYCERRFVSKYIPTVGVDFGVTTATIDGAEVRVSFYDLAGGSLYTDVREEFYPETQGIMLVVDVTSPKSFSSLDKWITEIGKAVEDACVILCANKIDKSNRQVTEADARLWAESRGFRYYEVSASSGLNVTHMIESLFKAVLATSRGTPHTNTAPKFSQKDIDVINQTTNAQHDYTRLRVRPNATKDEINKAYRAMAGLLHPDKNRAPGSEEAFKQLAASRTHLLSRLG
eukprot:m.282092 g.282092  ORF g.282092 m.282092 type:complete len:289 (+) comp159436_c0_seq1:163-1029(+)